MYRLYPFNLHTLRHFLLLYLFPSFIRSSTQLSTHSYPHLPSPEDDSCFHESIIHFTPSLDTQTFTLLIPSFIYSSIYITSQSLMLPFFSLLFFIPCYIHPDRVLPPTHSSSHLLVESLVRVGSRSFTRSLTHLSIRRSVDPFIDLFIGLHQSSACRQKSCPRPDAW